MPVGATVAAAGVGAAANVYEAGQAASAQKNAVSKANKFQTKMYNDTLGNIAPYQGALNYLTGISSGPNGQGSSQSYAVPGYSFGALTKQFAPTMDQLAATPGYQFTLDQGLKATQNGYAAQGLGTSGAALKGGADYASGLASQTFNQQLQNYLAQNQQTYNMLTGQQNQALTQGQLTAGYSGQVAGNIVGAGNAQAGADIATGNAIGQAAQAYPSSLFLQQYLSKGTVPPPNIGDWRTQQGLTPDSFNPLTYAG